MSVNQDKALEDLTDIVSSLEQKLKSLTIDLEAAKTSLAVLKQEKEAETASTTSNVQTKPRRTKRDKSKRSQQIKKYGFDVGDRVRVLNPTSKQTVHTGKVTGYTRNGYIKFTLDNDISTCRARQNLELIGDSI